MLDPLVQDAHCWGVCQNIEVNNTYLKSTPHIPYIVYYYIVKLHIHLLFLTPHLLTLQCCGCRCIGCYSLVMQNIPCHRIRVWPSDVPMTLAHEESVLARGISLH